MENRVRTVVLMMEWEGQKAGFVVSAGVATQGSHLTWELPWEAAGRPQQGGKGIADSGSSFP